MHKNGKWAQQIIALQQADGSWGNFHTLSQATFSSPITTEQALCRLRILGMTLADEPIQRAIAYLEQCLLGKVEIPDRVEARADWPIFLETMFAANLQMWQPNHELLPPIVNKWSNVIECACSTGSFQQATFEECYREAFQQSGSTFCFKEVVNVYLVLLLSRSLTTETERRWLTHIIQAPRGLYYLNCPQPIIQLPETFTSRSTSRYLGMIELLLRYDQASVILEFLVPWLWQHEDLGWDLGSSAKDQRFFPLSDDWRTQARRKQDCTSRIEKILRCLNEKSKPS